MSHLKREDLKEVLDLGQIALNCNSREELQQNSLENLEKSLGAKSSLFISILPETVPLVLRKGGVTRCSRKRTQVVESALP